MLRHSLATLSRFNEYMASGATVRQLQIETIQQNVFSELRRQQVAINYTKKMCETKIKKYDAEIEEVYL